MVVIKWPDWKIIPREEDGTVLVDDFSGSEESDDEREEDYRNADRLGDFHSNYKRDPSIVMGRSWQLARDKWEEDYMKYHEEHDLKLYRTRDRDIAELVGRCTVDGLPDGPLEHHRMLLRERLARRRARAKQQREDVRNSQVDPLHVGVPGLSAQYKAWTVTVDHSVDGNGMGAGRYINTNGVKPMSEYHWFGAGQFPGVFYSPFWHV
ncbi:hypothetical protein F5Y10DRAFT_229350 [Nemania abortiva]|nr:hypothetical protein F5Y10DRAFT_229350 [Nemania abortiva]